MRWRIDWGAGALRLGYNLGLAKAREWGLYISTSRGKTSIGIEEPPLFSEPGLFMVTPNERSITPRCKRCRSFARIFRNSSARSTSPSRTIIRRAENIPERFEPARAFCNHCAGDEDRPPVRKKYERICFEKSRVDRQPVAAFVCPDPSADRSGDRHGPRVPRPFDEARRYSCRRCRPRRGDHGAVSS